MWKYTPRQLAAYLFLAEKRRRRGLAETLAIGALAARGDSDEVNRRLKELDR